MKEKNSLLATFEKIVRARRSIRKFTNQKIDDKTLNSILTSANYCPSSFGLEPWKVLVIKNQTLKAELQKFCFNQIQVTSCSHFLVILTCKKKMFAQDHPWFLKRMKDKRSMTNVNEINDFYQNRFMIYMKEISDWDQWAIRQSYILLQTILLATTAHNIATSPMEVTDTQGLINYLEENVLHPNEKGNYNSPVTIALGYRDPDYQPRKKIINPLNETFTIIE
ncbi:MAG: nitroreductase family protein [Spiroplasma sp.]|nr:nitroreductase family protein [Spiroplasma sp.]